jgi:2-polyprenyl-3-methyl-5-hydroxy-6-metoxy-1,4-benzoquinol methylase
VSLDPHPYDNDRVDMLPLVPTGVRCALDVGCSTGGFVRLLKGAGVETVWGIEPDPTAATRAGDVADHVVTGHFPDDLPPTAPCFDLVVFNDVLEHMVDPWACLARTRELLRAGGTVIASVPNIRSLEVLYQLVVRGRFDYQQTGVLDATHLRFFTRATMIEMFEGAGYDVCDVRPVGVPGPRRVQWPTLVLPARAREELRTQQFGIVAQPRATS